MRWLAVVLVGGLLAMTGCIRRSLTIQTHPPGAAVYVNDELKGHSPLTYDFLWYGGYRVRIHKDGYEQLDDHQWLRAPIYLWIPFDFVVELLPVSVRDDRTWSYTLTPLRKLPTPIPPGAEHPAPVTTNLATTTGGASDGREDPDEAR